MIWNERAPGKNKELRLPYAPEFQIAAPEASQLRGLARSQSQTSLCAAKLALGAVDEVRRRLQQQICGHRGRKGDLLYGIRTIIRCDPDRLTERQWRRFYEALAADPRHEELFIAWQVAHELRQAYHHKDLPAGRNAAEKVLATLPSCPIPEIARLGRTLRKWKAAFLAYWTTGRSNNGGTEAINGLIELHRRLARGYRNRDNYRLRMLLIAGGLRT